MSDQGRIGPYVLVGELGRGAMARVWRAWDPNLEREVAVKEPLFDPSLPDGVLEEMGRRFVAEGRAAARLSHPNVVAIHAADVWDGRPAIVMELVEGETLSKLLSRGPLAPAEALPLLDQLLDALGYAHGRGVVHRDVKPDNVFVAADGTLKLADFGIARVDTGATRATVAGSVLGTPGYMSPEQARGAEVDGRSDLFSVGVIAYEMLAGSNPFGSGDATTLLYRIVHEPAPELPPSASAGLPADLRPAVMAALSKDPADRPATAADMKRMLHGEEPLRETTPNVMVKDSNTNRFNRKNSRSYTPYIIIGVACVLVLIVIIFSISAVNGVSSSVTGSSASTNQSVGSISVTFDGNGASGGSMTTLECAVNSSIAVPKCGFINDGHSFEGWKDSSGNTIQPGDTIVVQKDTVLSAIWKADNCKVAFLSAGGEGSMGDTTLEYGTRFTLPKCDFTMSGHEFTAWIDEKNNTYDPGDTILINGDKSFVAQWKEIGKTSSAVSSNASSINSQQQTSTILTAGTFPRNWSGTYEGYSDFTDDNIIRRRCVFEFTKIESSGSVEAVVYIGVSENSDGATTGSYAAVGSIDWQTGSIHLEGTRWVNKGGLIGWGGFNGTVSPQNRTISGQWYDPEDEAKPGSWYMSAM